MAKSGTFECSVITPEREVLRCQATSAVFTAHDGQVGVLLNHAPLLTKLGIGTVRVDSPEGNRTLFVDGGFAQVLDNTLTILTQQSRAPSDINGDEAKQALTDARALRITDEPSYHARQDAVRRAQVLIRLASDSS